MLTLLRIPRNIIQCFENVPRNFRRILIDTKAACWSCYMYILSSKPLLHGLFWLQLSFWLGTALWGLSCYWKLNIVYQVWIASWHEYYYHFTSLPAFLCSRSKHSASWFCLVYSLNRIYTYTARTCCADNVYLVLCIFSAKAMYNMLSSYQLYCVAITNNLFCEVKILLYPI